MKISGNIALMLPIHKATTATFNPRAWPSELAWIIYFTQLGVLDEC